MGLFLEIPRRAELAQSGGCSCLAKGLLGHPAEKRRKLRGKVAICGRKSGSSWFGHSVKRLAISRRNARVELVDWRVMLCRRPYFPRDSAALLIRMGAGLRPAKIGRHGGLHPKHGIPSTSFKLGLSSGRLVSPSYGPDRGLVVALVVQEAILLW